MDGKKISFGFSKVTKKLNLVPTKQSLKQENNVELIKCLEGQEIKLVQEQKEAAPLVINLKESQKTSAALASLMKRRAVLLGEEEPEIEQQQTKPDVVPKVGEVAESLEQRAARELIREVQKNGEVENNTNFVVPIVKPDDLPLDGAKEATLDDYENVPIQQFGLAMLRGMGWVEPPKTKAGTAVEDAPAIRPKGMGLGADKAIKSKPLLVQPEKNEVLEIKKQAYVRILGGKYRDLYGQIEGFDDHAGRVIVKMAIGGSKEAFNEFLCQPVSNKEYAQYGKCINSTKYDEYKKLENEYGQIIVKKDEKEEKLKIKRESFNNRTMEHESSRYHDDGHDFKDIKIKEERKERNRYDEYKEKYERNAHKRQNDDRDDYKKSSKYTESSNQYKEQKQGQGVNDDDDYKRLAKYDDERSKNTESSSRYKEDKKSVDSRKAQHRPRSKERSRDEHKHKSQASTSNSTRQTQRTPSDANATSDSGSSDSDSADERRYKKKSEHKAKKKSKKSKKKHHHRDEANSDDAATDDANGERKQKRQHKKKTKSSRKRTRSRSRSRR